MKELTPADMDHLPNSRLINLVKNGIVSVMMNSPVIGLDMSIEQTPEYQQFTHLRGIPISIGRAARKYNMNQSSISRYTSKGFIPILGRDKNRVMLDESYVAYVAFIRFSRPGQGKWLFKPDGTPYTPK